MSRPASLPLAVIVLLPAFSGSAFIVPGAEAAAPTVGTVTGKLTLKRHGRVVVSGACETATAYDMAGNVMRSAPATPLGRYVFRQLPAGSIKIGFASTCRPRRSDYGYAPFRYPIFLGRTPAFADATVLAVAPGRKLERDVRTPTSRAAPGLVVAGVVGPDGQRVGGVTVALYGLNGAPVATSSGSFGAVRSGLYDLVAAAPGFFQRVVRVRVPAKGKVHRLHRIKLEADSSWCPSCRPDPTVPILKAPGA